MLQTGSKPTWVWCLAFRQINQIDCWLFVCLRGHLSLVGSHLLSPAIPTWELPPNKRSGIPHPGPDGWWQTMRFHEELPGNTLVGHSWNSTALCFWWVSGFPGEGAEPWFALRVRRYHSRQGRKGMWQNECTPALGEFSWGSWQGGFALGEPLASLGVLVCKIVRVTGANTYWTQSVPSTAFKALWVLPF